MNGFRLLLTVMRMSEKVCKSLMGLKQALKNKRYSIDSSQRLLDLNQEIGDEFFNFPGNKFGQKFM